MSLADRVALVTGSTGEGIGRSIALALASAGAAVVLNYGTGRGRGSGADRAAELRAEIEGLGVRCIVVQADTRSEDEVRALYRRARSELGEVDILVNNAGASWLEQDLAEVSGERWRSTLEAELDGAFYCIREALPAMRARRWGRIVNIGLDAHCLRFMIDSVHGHVLHEFPHAFALAKAARGFLGRSIAHAEIRFGVTVNNVLPGIIEQMTLAEARADLLGEGGHRIGARPTDVAKAVLFLVGEDARFVTGSDLVIPGNLYSRLG